MTGDGSLIWKWVSGYPLSSSQYRPGPCWSSLLPPSFPSWGWPRHRAGTDSGASSSSTRCDSCSFFQLPPTVHLMRHHLGPGRPRIFFLGSQSSVSQPVKSQRSTGCSLFGRRRPESASQASLETFPDGCISCQVNGRTVSLIYLWRPSKALQDLCGGNHYPAGNSGGQVRGGQGPLGDRRGGPRSYVMLVWDSGSHTKTPHFHCCVSISMCFPG